MMNKEFLTRVDASKEAEKKPIGTVVVVVAVDPSKNGENATNPMLWTTIEKKSKSATERFAGQISFPAETRKIGEDRFSNMLGALPEFSENNNLIKNLVFMHSPLSYVEGRISVKNNPVDLAILLVSGFPGSPIEPLDVDEVSANGWMSFEDLKNVRKDNPFRLRSIVGQVIDMEESDKIIYSVVEDYFQFPGRRIPLSTKLPQDFSITGFYQQREKMRDIVGKK